MVHGQQFDPIAADEVRPAVAEVGDIDLAVLVQGAHGRGAHPPPLGLVAAGVADGVVGLPDRLFEGAVGRVVGRQAIADDPRDDVQQDDEARPQFAGVTLTTQAIEAVGDNSIAPRMQTMLYGDWWDAVNASDFVGVQAYTRFRFDSKGILAAPRAQN